MPADLSGLIDLQFSPGVLLLGSLIALVFLLLGFFCSLCGSAVSLSSVTVIKGLAQTGQKKTERALYLKNKADTFIGCAYTGMVLNSACSLIILASLFVPMLAKTLSAFWNAFASLAFAVLIVLLLFSLLFAGIVCLLPRGLALASPEKKLLRHARSFRFLCMLLSPVYYPAHGISSLLLRFSGSGNKTSAENETEEQILKIVDEGEEKGTIEGNTKSMIENVFDFDDTTVGEMMTHRKDVIAVSDDETLAALTQTAINSGKSRIPVYHDDIDDIIGIIYAKDLLRFVGVESKTDNPLKEIMRKPVYVPESKSCSEMFRFMTENKTQIAVVVDEFGGTGGIITMEDLIESILGNIQDEYDNEDDDIKVVNEYSFTVDGATSLDEIENLTGISFEGDRNDTLAGIMLDRMGHIPKSGEHPSIVINGTRFTVQEVDQRRISKVLVVKSHK